MSTPRAYGGMSDSRRPILAPGAAVQTYYPITYASAAYDDLAPSLYPQGAKAVPRSHGTRGKLDRASFYPIRPKGSVMGGASLTPVANAVGKFVNMVIAVISISFIAVGVGVLIAYARHVFNS